MTVELALFDPDPVLSLRKTKVLLEHVQSVVDTFRGAADADWRPTRLALGSLTLAVAPTNQAADGVPANVVHGLRTLAQDAELPPNWPIARATAVRRLVRAASRGTRIEVVQEGRAELSVVVDDALLTGVDRALRSTHTSFGSVVGHLRDLADRQKLVATLVLPTGEEVAIDFTDDLEKLVRQAWRSRRVEVTGFISERADGTPARIRLESLDVLPEDSTLRTDELQGGFYAGITDELDVDDYLARLRGTA